MAGGAAIAIAGGGALLWRETRRPGASPEAQLLLQKGLDALQQNDALDTELPAGAGAQAVALLTQATEALPDNATAWGGLAMAYAVRKRASAPSERPRFEQRSRAAAQRGLELDPKELRSLAALRMLEPVYRNWARAERETSKALKLHPNFPIHIFLMSDVLGSVGRSREAAELSKRADRRKFLIPGADRKVIANLWAAGDLQGADDALEQAIERWPEHPQVWRTRVAYLIYTGRQEEALALLRSRDRPAAVPTDLVDAATATAQVLAGRGDRSAAIEANLGFLKANPASALQVAQALVAMGETGTALSILEGYYFAEGPFASVSPPGGDADRHTAPLFMPPMRNLWSRPEFKTLLQRIGLEQYWRQSGTRPDYRS
jgi:tetratricopeptide (TPR) repeat protein